MLYILLVYNWPINIIFSFIKLDQLTKKRITPPNFIFSSHIQPLTFYEPSSLLSFVYERNRTIIIHVFQSSVDRRDITDPGVWGSAWRQTKLSCVSLDPHSIGQREKNKRKWRKKRGREQESTWNVFRKSIKCPAWPEPHHSLVSSTDSTTYFVICLAPKGNNSPPSPNFSYSRWGNKNPKIVY